MHRRSSLASSAVVASALIASTASAQPKVTTQACLGELSKFLTCPAGAQLMGTECRAREPHRGQAAGEHWSGSQRQGPAVFLRDEDERDPARQRVSFAALYKDHKKTGRMFRFDPEGRLESWDDVDGDQPHGLSVTCLPDGRVSHLAYYDHGRNTGVSRSWRSRDGAFSYAFQYDGEGHGTAIEVPAALRERPDALCAPVTCDVRTRPDLSGVPGS